MESVYFTPGAVQTTSVQPRLAAVLREALATELAARGALAPSSHLSEPHRSASQNAVNMDAAGMDAAGAQPASILVQLHILSAESVVQATRSGQRQQLHEARLVVEVQTAGLQPRVVVLRGARSYPLNVDDPIAAAAERERAMSVLASELMQDAAEWLLYMETH